MSDNLKAFFLDICVGSEKGRFGGNDMRFTPSILYQTCSLNQNQKRFPQTR